MALTQVQGQMLSGSTNTTTTIQSNGTTAITIDSSQNVGIGTASPSTYGKLATYSTSIAGANIALTKGDSGTANQNGQILYFNNIGPAATGRNAGTFIGTIYWQASQPSSGALQDAAQISCVAETQTGNNTASALTFYTNTGNAGNAERMRIDSSGRLLVNNTSSADSNAKIQAFVNGGNGSTGYIGIYGGGSSYANQQAGFHVGQANCIVYQAWDGAGVSRNSVYVQAVSQGVQLSNGGTSWSAISDERKKDIIEPISDALNKVDTLRAVIGKYKNEENVRRSFLIAQDVQAVLPEAITIEDEGQETEKLLLSYTDVIPLLVASIKELKAEVDSLKAQLAK